MLLPLSLGGHWAGVAGPERSERCQDQRLTLSPASLPWLCGLPYPLFREPLQLLPRPLPRFLKDRSTTTSVYPW